MTFNAPFIEAHDVNRSHTVLAISMGDMNGIGPEVILKALDVILHHEPESSFGVILFSHPNVINDYAKRSGMDPGMELLSVEPASPTGCLSDSNSYFNLDYKKIPVPGPGRIVLVPANMEEVMPEPGRISEFSGKLSMDAVSAGVTCCLSGQADALVTGPISKEAITKAGYNVPGHTEYLAQLTNSKSAGMMLVSDKMRIGLATIHIPHRKVAENLTIESITNNLRLFNKALKNDFCINKPQIAVLGLNPHAGDGGVIGSEEIDIIKPAISIARNEGINASGPWPADGFFGNKAYKEVDLVLAMYHDQGLIPLKLSGFGSGVNVTTGLPIIRTSPDHGTAFPIAGKNKADAGSMISAIHMALQIVEMRKDNGSKQ